MLEEFLGSKRIVGEALPGVQLFIRLLQCYSAPIRQLAVVDTVKGLGAIGGDKLIRKHLLNNGKQLMQLQHIRAPSAGLEIVCGVVRQCKFSGASIALKMDAIAAKQPFSPR